MNSVTLCCLPSVRLVFSRSLVLIHGRNQTRGSLRCKLHLEARGPGVTASREKACTAGMCCGGACGMLISIRCSKKNRHARQRQRLYGHSANKKKRPSDYKRWPERATSNSLYGRSSSDSSASRSASDVVFFSSIFADHQPLSQPETIIHTSANVSMCTSGDAPGCSG